MRNYVWTFAISTRVEWSGESRESIMRRIATYPGTSDSDRTEVITFMDQVEKDGQPTFAQFRAFDTILFYLPGII